jgi:antitoxin HicB
VLTTEECLKRSYLMDVVEDPDEGGYVVSFPSLPGCLTCADSLSRALENAEDAKRAWFEAALEDGAL